MTKFGDWIRGRYVPMHDGEYDLASLTAQLHAVAKGYEQWEADMLLDSGVWRSEDGLPHLTQHLYDKLMLLQEQRTTALAACKEFQDRYGQ